MEQNNKSGKTKGIIVFVMAFVIAFVLAFLVSRNYFGDHNTDAELIEIVKEMNKQTPMRVDEMTRLDSVAASGSSGIVYYYTLPDTEISEINADTINKYVRPVILENVKNNPGLEPLRKKKVTMDYRYYDKKGEFIEEVSVHPDLYRND
ncbi:hypothetical protein SAMN02927921_00323 [Sinomicrobium oceani]|uniref:Uncharacterized protein n=1 Tax=Sinomicrobium oceani TaxID=1150368 RepID=A0A1K1M285_9FLAO|nr:hypothetical protein [Sinomicrobium oceani]SFW17217.1 hypothetical protein SAMN02927921_00323 [Sinomicrobium oceani]